MRRDGSTCEQVRERLADLIYGELGESSERSLREHLDGCEACRRELSELERVLSVMRSAPSPELPPGLEARVMSEARRAVQVDQEPAPARGAAPGWLARLLAPAVLRPALVTAAMVLLVAGIAILLSERRGSVVERYMEEPGEQVAPAVEAPASPPVEPAIPSEAPPPPYPTPGTTTVEREGQAVARPDDELALAAGKAAGEAKQEASLRSQPEGTAAVEDELEVTAAEASAPPAKKGDKAKLVGTTSGADLDAVLGGTKDDSLSDEANKAGTLGASTKSELAVPEEPAAGFMAGAAASDDTAPAPKPAATPPQPAKKAPAPGATPAPSPAAPSYAPPAADMESDETLEEESALDKKSPKKSLKEKWAEWKAKKKKSKGGGKSADMSASPAAEQAPPAAQKPASDPFELAMTKKKEKKYDEAVTILTSLKKNPSSTTASPARVLHELATCLARAGKTDKALVAYENLFAKHPGYAGLHKAMWEAAQLYLDAGDKKHARTLLEKLAGTTDYGEKARKQLEKIK